MSDIQRSLDLMKLARLAVRAKVSAISHLLKWAFVTEYAGDSVDLTHLLCLFLSGPIIAA